ncbi:class II aldolase/adducin family protein [Paraburkholderia strydomiana]|uniref:class II aldolase/adducin family protein n=1 Tax=Paraburkholderia strydomiana TaxID=1245417 RepID=UPI0038BAF04E
MDELVVKALKAWRFLYRHGFIEGFGHISVRLPGNRFMVTRHSLGLEAGSEDFVVMDLDGNKLEGAGDPPREYPIHLEIYAARPDVNSVVHYHGMYSTAFTTSGRQLRPIHLMGTLFHEGIPTYDDPRLINDRERGAYLAQTLGRNRAVLMCAHGATVTGESIEEMVVGAFLFEENAQRATISATLGEPVWINDELAANAGNELLKSRGPFRRVWALVEQEHEEFSVENRRAEEAGTFRVMTSGIFTAAYQALVPKLEKLIGKKVVTLTTSIGTGEKSISNRLKRFEAVDLVIAAECNMREFVDHGLILEDSARLVAKSSLALAVREGRQAPDVSTPDALKETFLAAEKIAYSASASGKYLTTQLYQKLGIADECLPKSLFVGDGERTGAVVAREEADLAFQQLSELLPVPGIAHITPIPEEFQVSFRVGVGVPTWSRNAQLSRSVIRYIASEESRDAIAESGLKCLIDASDCEWLVSK